MEFSINQQPGENNASLKGMLTIKEKETFQTFLAKFLSPNIHSYKLNLSGITRIDSIGLGMLLLLSNKADKNNAKIILENPQAQVKEALKIASFDKIFKIKN